MLAWVELPVVERLGVDTLAVPRLAQDFELRIDAFRERRLDGGVPVRMPANFAPVEEPDGS